MNEMSEHIKCFIEIYHVSFKITQKEKNGKDQQ